MIGCDAIDEIVAVYLKHGWILRRVLLSAKLKAGLEETGSRLFECPAVVDSDIDAAWFSRPPKEGGVPWELRHLSDAPYALLENVDEHDATFEDKLNSVEERLRRATVKRKPA